MIYALTLAEPTRMGIVGLLGAGPYAAIVLAVLLVAAWVIYSGQGHGR